MRTILPLMVLTTFAVTGPGLNAAEGLSARAAFDVLKSLAGEWTGPVGKVKFRVTSGGSAVFERQFPDEPHEMTSVYHLDGEELLMTHYCAAGNQPRMKLNRQKSTAKELVFDHLGGTNMDPAKDGHVHDGRLRVTGPGTYAAEWYFYSGGTCAGTNRFAMTRVAK